MGIPLEGEPLVRFIIFTQLNYNRRIIKNCYQFYAVLLLPVFFVFSSFYFWLLRDDIYLFIPRGYLVFSLFYFALKKKSFSSFFTFLLIQAKKKLCEVVSYY